MCKRGMATVLGLFYVVNYNNKLVNFTLTLSIAKSMGFEKMCTKMSLTCHSSRCLEKWALNYKIITLMCQLIYTFLHNLVLLGRH